MCLVAEWAVSRVWDERDERDERAVLAVLVVLAFVMAVAVA